VTTLTTVLGGLAGTHGIIGFGANDTALVAGGIIDTTGSFNLAFSMPRDGVITAISAYFSVGAAATLIGSTITITAQLWSSTAPNDVFSPIPGTLVTLSPPLTGIVTVGTLSFGSLTGLSIPVTQDTRIMMVFSARVTDGIDIATIITGFASGGVSIE